MSEERKGRKVKADPVTVARWRQSRKATAAETAKQFGISERTVRAYCKEFGAEAEKQRRQWHLDCLQAEVDALEYYERNLILSIQCAKEAHEEYARNPTTENFFFAICAANRMVPREFRNKRPK